MRLVFLSITGKVLSTPHAYTRSMSWESEVNRYANVLKIGGRKGNPATPGYISNFRSYAGALGKALKPDSFLAITGEELTAWIIRVRDHGIKGRRTQPLADASLNSIKGVLKAFFRFLSPDGKTNPLSFRDLTIGGNRSRVNRADLPSDEDVSRLANALSPRYKAIFLTIRYSGARPSEVLKLTRKHVSPEWQLTFKDTKTKTHRTAPLVKSIARRALKVWMDQAPEDGYLFPSPDPRREGQPLGYQSLWIAQKRAAKKLGMEPINPYNLRHARGTELMDEGMNPAYIMETMGWKADATMRNYSHTDPEKIRQRFEEMEGEKDDGRELVDWMLAIQARIASRPDLEKALTETQEIMMRVLLENDEWREHMEKVSKMVEDLPGGDE